ncbi:hypothetical protein EUU23_09430 [Sphingorhabdus sp. IMCC26285]|uniref:Uncharacterized protein n=1 Tax=Sphingorhabdus profundilacus TaxID=2509718 RepID=A0A6I4LWJ8_9SPHN|nr:hypothetical protein [Sphingorhabdus profundilacus]MVZ97927.1 hypothetical protein [Sphingorhabdus profundilacus]
MSDALLTVDSNRDAEIAVLDATLSRVAAVVGRFEQRLPTGLYKIKVNRGGAMKEQLIELTPQGRRVSLYIIDFPAIAPIGSMVADQQGLETLAQKALGRVRGPALLLLEHYPTTVSRSPFSGVRVMPWRKVSEGIALGSVCRDTGIFGNERWSAVALEVEHRGDTWVLEIGGTSFSARHAIPLTPNWQTRVFMRGLSAREGAGALCETSVQMAPSNQSVVYWDHWETVEVARRSLETGRNIFSSDGLVEDLLHNKFDNPIAGMTGLHLMLDGLASTPQRDWPTAKVKQIDDVLQNLTGLLQPGRRNRLYNDPAWTELPDMTALRLKAGRLLGQVEVREPPLFKASWDALKGSASKDGLIWIGRSLWRATGDGNRMGPYMSWAPRHHSWRDTEAHMERQTDQSREFGLTFDTSELTSIGQAKFIRLDIAAAAQANNVPLSIFEKPLRGKADTILSDDIVPLVDRTTMA